MFCSSTIEIQRKFMYSDTKRFSTNDIDTRCYHLKPSLILWHLLALVIEDHTISICPEYHRTHVQACCSLRNLFHNSSHRNLLNLHAFYHLCITILRQLCPSDDDCRYHRHHEVDRTGNPETVAPYPRAEPGEEEASHYPGNQYHAPSQSHTCI